MTARELFEQKKRRLIRQMTESGGGVRLAKATSNLFRDRDEARGGLLDVRDFNRVLAIDAEQRWVETEGMTTYADLTDATLAQDAMVAVVPQLKSITIGGAVAGIGIESSSFRYGLPHETVLEMEVLVGDGRVLTCSPDNEHRDLFFGLPNSYGTLGYVLKVKARLFPVKPFVGIEHHRFGTAQEFFDALAHWCRRDVDFVDATVFAPGEHYLTVGRFADEAPYTSDYTYLDIYYRSLRTRKSDYLTTRDYIWRWDTDWFWCSKNLYVQNPLVRRLVGRRRLNSVSYTKVMRWNNRWGLTRRLERLLGYHCESVIQDVDIPIENAARFLEFFHQEIGIAPIWVCPIGHYHRGQRFPLYPLDADTLYVNFGFWDSVRSREQRPPGYLNRKVERAVAELGGIKSLYSDSYYSREEFWQIYNRPAYRELKSRYDPDGRFKDLFEKCVLRQ